MNVEALVLIEEDTDAQKLCVTWPQIGAAYEAAQQSEQPGHLDQVRQRWCSISGVDITDLLRLEPVLFVNGLLGPSGSLDPTVSGFIRSRIARHLPRPARRAPQHGGSER